jgi:hypothetical protein
MWKKAAAILAALGIVFALGLLVGWLSYRVLAGRGGLFNSVTLVQKIQTLSQLVTVKYTLEKVVEFDDAKWYGDSRVLLVAHGVAKAGIDLGQVEPKDIDISGKTIRMTLPPPRITDVYLDDRQTQVVDHTTGLLRFYDKDLEQDARQQAVEELREAASHSGILTDATQRARSELTNLFSQLGFSEIDLRSK